MHRQHFRSCFRRLLCKIYFVSSSTINVHGYTITTETNPEGNAPLPSEVAPIIERLYRDAQDKRKIKIVNELKTLVEKYPQLPVLQNYLSMAYKVRGSGSKAVEINKKLAEDFPDSLFLFPSLFGLLLVSR